MSAAYTQPSQLDSITDALAVLWPVLVLAVIIGGLIGWALHRTYLRARVRVDEDDAGFAVIVGRAVAGYWRTKVRADWHADRVRRQMGGER